MSTVTTGYNATLTRSIELYFFILLVSYHYSNTNVYCQQGTKLRSHRQYYWTRTISQLRQYRQAVQRAGKRGTVVVK